MSTTSNGSSRCQSRIQSSIASSDDEMGVPTGAFGIVATLPRTANTREATAAAAEFSMPQSAQTHEIGLEPSSLIPISGMPLEEGSSYNTDLDLPARRSRNYDTSPLVETLASAELSVGRAAMIAALGLFGVELTTGTSLPDQIISMIG